MATYDRTGKSKDTMQTALRVDLRPPEVQAEPCEMEVYGCQEKGGKEFQEDSFCTFHSPDSSVVAAAIYDGHGGFSGRIASSTCAGATMKWFHDNWEAFPGWDDAEWKKKGTDLFHELNKRIREALQQPQSLEKKKVRVTGGKFKDQDGVVEKWIASHNQWGIKLDSGKKIRASKTMVTVYGDELLHVDERGIVRQPNGSAVHGGTTGTVSVCMENGDHWRVVTINAGDSDCLLAPSDSQAMTVKEDKWKHLSTDHGPDSETEFFRIKNLPDDQFPEKLLFVYDKSNVREKYQCPKVFRPDGTKDPKFVKNPWGNGLKPTNVRYEAGVYAVTPGPTRDITCIAMTRSLGDLYAHQFGLTWRPDIDVRKLPKDKAYTICPGSDGIWDCWKYENFSDHVNQTHTNNRGDLTRTCEDVLEFTVKKAKQSFGVRAFDDASLCLMRCSTLKG